MCLRRAFFLWRLCFVCCLYISTQEVANPNPRTVTYSWISLSSSNNPTFSCTDVVRKHHWNSTSSWCIICSIICGLEFSRMDFVLKYCRVISSTITKNVYVISFTCHSPPPINGVHPQLCFLFLDCFISNKTYDTLHHFFPFRECRHF